MQPQTPELLVRAYARDLDKVLAWIRQYYEYDKIPFSSVAIRQGLDVLLKNPSYGYVWLVRSGESNAGYAIMTYGFDLEFGGRQATVTDLYLGGQWRRLGLGTRVMRAIERVCRKEGICALELQVSRDNVSAQTFYRRLGFTKHDRLPLSKTVKRVKVRSRP